MEIRYQISSISEFGCGLSSVVHTGVEVYRMDLLNDLGFSLCAALSVCHVVTTSDDGEKSRIGVSVE